MNYPLRLRIILGVINDANLQFELSITQSKKFQIRINHIFWMEIVKLVYLDWIIIVTIIIPLHTMSKLQKN